MMLCSVISHLFHCHTSINHRESNIRSLALCGATLLVSVARLPKYLAANQMATTM